MPLFKLQRPGFGDFEIKYSMPFDHKGHRFAIHRPIKGDPARIDATRWTVSHFGTGGRVCTGYPHETRKDVKARATTFLDGLPSGSIEKAISPHKTINEVS